ncbi:restriction endonuclease subunit S [Methylotuvimicrobium sp.]|uniref:restriction endonuclease subunit S n=1 Tax=Methylotuvimicrobium sp. TaxID=2822413 RepID=UPI003D64751E
MSGWKNTCLADVCSDISYGYTASANQNGVGPKFLRITDIVPKRINWNEVPNCLASEKDIEKYKLKEGDIVIARTGATTGYNKIIKNLEHDAVYASYLIRYEINKNLACPEYVGHILQSSSWYDYVDAIAGGSAQPGANAKQLGSFEFQLPTIPEQEAIAAVLSSLDDKIDLLHRQNKTLETMAETLFRQWFIEEAGEDWDEGRLGDVIELHYGKGLKTEERAGRGYPVVGSSGIVDHHTEFLIKGPGIVIGRKGTLGKVIYLWDNFYPIDTTYYVKSNVESAGLLYEYFLLKTIGFEDMNTDSAVPGLNRDIALSTEIRIPPEDKLHAFNELVADFVGKLKTNRDQILTLEKLRDTLLPKLMNGEIRVKIA